MDESKYYINARSQIGDLQGPRGNLRAEVVDLIVC